MEPRRGYEGHIGKQTGYDLRFGHEYFRKIEGKPIPYFFYQVEDGHGYLSEGRVEVQADGSFASTIHLKSPTNGHGTINFYGDVNQNGQFDIEEDTVLKLGFADLVFEPSLIVR